MLKRAIRTLWHALDEMDRTWLPVVHCWRLNERHYGALQGLNKAETAKKYGDEQVLVWRRSYDTPPPALEPSDPRSERSDLRYARLPARADAADRMPEGHGGPRAAVLERSRWRRPSRPASGVVVAAHGNRIRALVKYLDGISDDDIVGLNIPNGIPLVYELDADLKPLRHYYLGDAEAAAKAAAAVGGRKAGDRGEALDRASGIPEHGTGQHRDLLQAVGHVRVLQALHGLFNWRDTSIGMAAESQSSRSSAGSP